MFASASRALWVTSEDPWGIICLVVAFFSPSHPVSLSKSSGVSLVVESLLQKGGILESPVTSTPP